MARPGAALRREARSPRARLPADPARRRLPLAGRPATAENPDPALLSLGKGTVLAHKAWRPMPYSSLLSLEEDDAVPCPKDCNEPSTQSPSHSACTACSAFSSCPE